MQKLIEHWKNYLSDERVKEYIKDFKEASLADKECIISGAYGIFNGSVKGNIYTYYFYNCDTINHIYIGTEKWHKGAKCFKVEYNFVTDKIRVIPLKKWNHKADENRMRML